MQTDRSLYLEHKNLSDFILHPSCECNQVASAARMLSSSNKYFPFLRTGCGIGG